MKKKKEKNLVLKIVQKQRVRTYHFSLANMGQMGRTCQAFPSRQKPLRAPIPDSCQRGTSLM